MQAIALTPLLEHKGIVELGECCKRFAVFEGYPSDDALSHMSLESVKLEYPSSRCIVCGKVLYKSVAHYIVLEE